MLFVSLVGVFVSIPLWLAAFDTGRYRLGRPTVLRSDGAIEGVYMVPGRYRLGSPTLLRSDGAIEGVYMVPGRWVDMLTLNCCAA